MAENNTNNHIESKEVESATERLHIGLAGVRRLADRDYRTEVRFRDYHWMDLEVAKEPVGPEKKYKVKGFTAQIGRKDGSSYRGEGDVIGHLLLGEGKPLRKLLMENRKLWEDLKSGLFMGGMTLRGDFGEDASLWPEIGRSLKALEFQDKNAKGAPWGSRQGAWDKQYLYVEDTRDGVSRELGDRSLELYKKLAEIINEIVEKHGDRMEIFVEESEVVERVRRWRGSLVLRWKKGMRPKTPEEIQEEEGAKKREALVEDVRKEVRAELLAPLQADLRRLEERIQALEKENDGLRERNVELESKVREMGETNRRLTEELDNSKHKKRGWFR